MSSMNRLRLAIMFTALMAASGAGWAQTGRDVYLSTQRAESRLVEVAVPEFPFSGRDPEKLGSRASRIINYDLRFSGYFKPSENYDFMRQVSRGDLKAGRIDYDEWRSLASNFLIKGSLSSAQEGKLSAEIRVYDLQTRKIFFAKRYLGSRALFRQMIHQFSDDFLMRMTGEKGVARTKIALVSRIAGHKELMIMDYDGFNPRTITSDKSIVLFPHWNPSNKSIILFTTYRYRNPDLYAVNFKTKTRYPISRRVGLNSTGEWSPDGSKVAFSLSRHGNSDIYTCDADGSDLKRLTYARSIETSPTWSPDSQNIAFTSDRSGSPQIYSMKIGASGARRLTYKGSYNDGASWSPKDGQIAYTSLLGRKFDIAMLNIIDRSITRLTFGQGSNEYPSWSPNGKSLAFTSTRTGSRQVYTMNVRGSSQRQVTFLSGGGYLPSWGPD